MLFFGWLAIVCLCTMWTQSHTTLLAYGSTNFKWNLSCLWQTGLQQIPNRTTCWLCSLHAVLVQISYHIIFIYLPFTWPGWCMLRWYITAQGFMLSQRHQMQPDNYFTIDILYSYNSGIMTNLLGVSLIHMVQCKWSNPMGMEYGCINVLIISLDNCFATY